MTFYEKLSDKKSRKNVVMTLISRTQFKMLGLSKVSDNYLEKSDYEARGRFVTRS